MHERAIGARTPPAVPTIPLAELIARADAIAKRWLIEVLDAAPLAAAGAVPAAELAADGPAVCAATVEAVASDAGLRSVLGHAPDVARLAGATTPAEAIAAAEALRRATFAALQEELPPADTATLAAAGHRLAHVAAALAQASGGEAARSAQPGADRPAADAPAAEPAPSHLGGAAAPAPARAGAEPGAPVVPLTRPPEADFGPLWMGALERQIGAGGRFALLLLELDGADRLRAAEKPETLAGALEKVGRALRRCIRREDVLAHETDGRLWVIAPGVGRPGASALARRIAQAVEQAAELRGAPLTASVGAALFPDDARDPAGLAGEAEQGVLAARAAGLRFAGDPDDPDQPALGPRLVR